MGWFKKKSDIHIKINGQELSEHELDERIYSDDKFVEVLDSTIMDKQEQLNQIQSDCTQLYNKRMCKQFIEPQKKIYFKLQKKVDSAKKMQFQPQKKGLKSIRKK